MNSRGWWLSSNSICLLSILHEFAWTMATLKQYFFIIYSPRIHMDDSYPRTASFYYLFSTNSCGRWLLSNNIFLSPILHKFMWTMATFEQYLFIISVISWMMAIRGWWPFVAFEGDARICIRNVILLEIHETVCLRDKDRFVFVLILTRFLFGEIKISGTSKGWKRSGGYNW